MGLISSQLIDEVLAGKDAATLICGLFEAVSATTRPDWGPVGKAVHTYIKPALVAGKLGNKLHGAVGDAATAGILGAQTGTLGGATLGVTHELGRRLLGKEKRSLKRAATKGAKLGGIAGGAVGALGGAGVHLGGSVW